MIIDDLKKLKNNIKTNYLCHYGNSIEEYELSYFDIQDNLNTEKALNGIVKYIKLLMLNLAQNNILYNQINIILDVGIFVNSNICNEEGKIDNLSKEEINYLDDVVVISWYNYSYSDDNTIIMGNSDDIPNYNPPVCYVKLNELAELLKNEGLEISIGSFDKIKEGIFNGKKQYGTISITFEKKKQKNL